MTDTAERKLPATNIATIFVWLNYFSAALVAAGMGLGFAVPLVPELLYYHIPVGLGAAVIGLFALVSVMFYLIVTGTGIREASLRHELSADLYDRTKPFKKHLFPLAMATIILLIAMTVLGGAVHMGKVDKNVHLFFAFCTAIAYYYTIKKIKEVFAENRLLIADTIDAINDAVDKAGA